MTLIDVICGTMLIALTAVVVALVVAALYMLWGMVRAFHLLGKDLDR
jgi:hypothetical protein